MKNRKLYEAKRLKIGNTPLIRDPELEKQFGITNLLVKDESINLFGTFKDRRNVLAIDRAMEKHVDKLAIITSGNAGNSLARLAEGTGIKVVCVVDKSLNSNIRKSLEKYSYRVIEVNLSEKRFEPKDVIELTRETGDEVIWDVTNGYDAAFESIVMEIKEEAPDWLITPLGAGEAFVGLHKGLKKYLPKTKLVGAGVHRLREHKLELRARPSKADKLYTPYTPYQEDIEKILNESSRENLYVHLSDKQIMNVYRRISSKISCEPSSAAAFASLPKLDIGRESKVVVVNSGKGIWTE